jgi:hypothetical protein
MNSLQLIEQKLVNFNGDEIMTIKGINGKVHAGIKWICIGLGFNDDQAKYQIRKAQDDLVVSKGVSKITLPTNGGLQEVLMIELDYLPIWLAKINANIITDDEVQEKLVSYQLRAKDVLAAAFIAPITPLTTEDMIILQAQSVKELKAKVDQMQAQLTTAHSRIDNLDHADIVGDPQQKLVSLINKYALETGLQHSTSWMHFCQAYNIAYRTNITLLKLNYEKKRGKKMTTPEYLVATGLIQDGLRVADKLISQGNPNLAFNF